MPKNTILNVMSWKYMQRMLHYSDIQMTDLPLTWSDMNRQTRLLSLEHEIFYKFLWFFFKKYKIRRFLLDWKSFSRFAEFQKLW